jgi:hypothetical protein
MASASLNGEQIDSILVLYADAEWQIQVVANEDI